MHLLFVLSNFVVSWLDEMDFNYYSIIGSKFLPKFLHVLKFGHDLMVSLVPHYLQCYAQNIYI